ncbi:hypothetical protein [Streptomyces atratus]
MFWALWTATQVSSGSFSARTRVDGGDGWILALVLAGGDEERGRDLGYGDATGGVVGHVVVEDLGPSAVAAPVASGCLSFEGFLADVLAFGLGHAGEEREEGGAVPGGVVDPLERGQ